MRQRLAIILCASALFGCGQLGIKSTCARPATEDPVAYNEGFIDGSTYMSADWTGPLLSYPGGAYYELHHGLGDIPNGVQIYLSFSEAGLTAGDSSLAQAAGNQAEIKAIDEEQVTILNGSCVDYFMLTVAWIGDADGGGGQGGN